MLVDIPENTHAKINSPSVLRTTPNDKTTSTAETSVAESSLAELRSSLVLKGVPANIIEAIATDTELDLSRAVRVQPFPVNGMFQPVRAMIEAEAVDQRPTQPYEFAQGMVDNGFDQQNPTWFPPRITVGRKEGGTTIYDGRLPADTTSMTFLNHGSLNLAQLTQLGSITGAFDSTKLGGYGQGYRVALISYLAQESDILVQLRRELDAGNLPNYRKFYFEQAIGTLEGQSQPVDTAEKYAIVQSNDLQSGPYKVFCYRIPVIAGEEGEINSWQMGFVICSVKPDSISQEQANAVSIKLVNMDLRTRRLYAKAPDFFLYLNPNYEHPKNLVKPIISNDQKPGAEVKNNNPTVDVSIQDWQGNADYRVTMLNESVTSAVGVFLNGLKLEPYILGRLGLGGCSWNIEPRNSHARHRISRTSDSSHVTGDVGKVVQTAIARLDDPNLWEKIYREATRAKQGFNSYLELEPAVQFKDDRVILGPSRQTIHQALRRIDPSMQMPDVEPTNDIGIRPPDFFTNESDITKFETLAAVLKDPALTASSETPFLISGYTALVRILECYGFRSSGQVIEEIANSLASKSSAVPVRRVVAVATDTSPFHEYQKDMHGRDVPYIILKHIRGETIDIEYSAGEEGEGTISIYIDLPPEICKRLANLEEIDFKEQHIFSTLAELVFRGYRVALQLTQAEKDGENTRVTIGAIGLKRFERGLLLWRSDSTQPSAEGMPSTLVITGPRSEIDQIHDRFKKDVTGTQADRQITHQAILLQRIMDQRLRVGNELAALRKELDDTRRLLRDGNPSGSIRARPAAQAHHKVGGIYLQTDMGKTLDKLLDVNRSTAADCFLLREPNNTETAVARPSEGELTNFPNTMPDFICSTYGTNRYDFHALGSTDSTDTLPDGIQIAVQTYSRPVDADTDPSGESIWFAAKPGAPQYDIGDLNCTQVYEVTRELHLVSSSTGLPFRGDMEVAYIQLPTEDPNGVVLPRLYYDLLNDQYFLKAPDSDDEVFSIPRGTRFYLREGNRRKTVTETWIRNECPEYLDVISKPNLRLDLITNSKIRDLLNEIRLRADLTRDDKVNVMNSLGEAIFLYDEGFKPENPETCINTGRGICKYFAEALAEMCKYVGVPARIKFGYPDPGRNGFLQPPLHAQVEYLGSDGEFKTVNPKIRGLFRVFGDRIKESLLDGTAIPMHEISSLELMLRESSKNDKDDTRFTPAINEIRRQSVDIEPSLLEVARRTQRTGQLSPLDRIRALTGLYRHANPETKVDLEELEITTVSNTVARFVNLLLLLQISGQLHEMDIDRAKGIIRLSIEDFFMFPEYYRQDGGDKMGDPIKLLERALRPNTFQKLQNILKTGMISKESLGLLCKIYLLPHPHGDSFIRRHNLHQQPLKALTQIIESLEKIAV